MRFHVFHDVWAIFKIKYVRTRFIFSTYLVIRTIGFLLAAWRLLLHLKFFAAKSRGILVRSSLGRFVSFFTLKVNTWTTFVAYERYFSDKRWNYETYIMRRKCENRVNEGVLSQMWLLANKMSTNLCGNPYFVSSHIKISHWEKIIQKTPRKVKSNRNPTASPQKKALLPIVWKKFQNWKTFCY